MRYRIKGNRYKNYVRSEVNVNVQERGVGLAASRSQSRPRMAMFGSKFGNP